MVRIRNYENANEFAAIQSPCQFPSFSPLLFLSLPPNLREPKPFWGVATHHARLVSCPVCDSKHLATMASVEERTY
jgi:hypothetical protein